MKYLLLIIACFLLLAFESRSQNGPFFSVTETQSGVVRIDVETGEDDNLSSYHIERSTDTRAWAPIEGETHTGSRGSSNRFYMFDKAQAIGICFYRLVYIDSDKNRTELAWMPLGGQVEYFKARIAKLQ